MSSQKTAEYFKDKTEEEIITWMLTNMAPEQIKSCFSDIPEISPDTLQETPSDPLKNLRINCENKRYVIHKIEGDQVFFWYYFIKKDKWIYSIQPLSNFPKYMGENSDECGTDTIIDDDFEKELKSSYINDNLDSQEKFSKFNNDLQENEVFNEIKTEYENQSINKNWNEVEETINTLLTAINIQKKVPALPSQKDIFIYAPVLIEATTEDKVYYYYLKNENGQLRFIYDNIKLEDFDEDITEVVNNLNLEISVAGMPGSSNSKTVDEWKQSINEAVNKIDEDDLLTIKNNYNEFPLSKETPFFMKNLFGNSFGNSFGKSTDLSQYVMNKFGSNTANLFTAKVISNKFGINTIALVKK